MFLTIITSVLVFTLSVVYYFKIRQDEVSFFSKKKIYLDYKTFIECLLVTHRSAKVLALKKDYLRITDSRNTFFLTKVHDRISVVWTLSSEEFGQRGMEWVFSYDHDQIKMYTEVNKDICDYKSTVLSRNN